VLVRIGWIVCFISLILVFLSHLIGPIMKTKVEFKVNKQDVNDTTLMVRIPAGRSAVRRSYPIMLPSSTDMTMFLPNSHSRRVNPINCRYLTLL
jgi:hypothetical protein